MPMASGAAQAMTSALKVLDIWTRESLNSTLSIARQVFDGEHDTTRIRDVSQDGPDG